MAKVILNVSVDHAVFFGLQEKSKSDNVKVSHLVNNLLKASLDIPTPVVNPNLEIEEIEAKIQKLESIKNLEIQKLKSELEFKQKAKKQRKIREDKEEEKKKGVFGKTIRVLTKDLDKIKGFEDF